MPAGSTDEMAMSPGRRKNTQPALFVALGVLLFAGVFGVVQWVLDPLQEEEAAAAAVAATAARAPAAPPDPVPTVVELNTSGRDSGPCRIAIAGESPVARACAEGGIAAAKQEMRRLVSAAKTNGVVFACDSCHDVGGTEHDLVGGARDKFRTLVASAQAAPAPAEAAVQQGAPSAP